LPMVTDQFSMEKIMRRTVGWWVCAIVAAASLATSLTQQSALAACITDDTGTEVCVEDPARVVSLYGAFTEILWELGVRNRLVARTKNDTTIEEVRALPSVGTGLRPNVEYLLALRPQLVISRASRAAGNTLASLRERGLTVAAFDPRSMDDLYHTVRRLGALTGSDPAAHALTAQLADHLAVVAARTADVPVEKRLSVVFEVRADPLTVAGQGGLLNDIIAAAGGRNAVTSPKKLLMFDVEALLHLSPDTYVVQEGPMNRNPLPPAQRPHTSALECVGRNRVLQVNEKLFSRPGPRVAEAAETLSRFLYPERWKTP
jgi:iron complex transport system substrate-binding protein